MKKKFFKNQEGISLYLSIIILTAVFGIGFGISGILFNEIKIARDISQFTQAIYAADAGTERALYTVRKTSNFDTCRGVQASCEFLDIQLDNDASYSVIVMDGGFQWCDVSFGKCIRSLGSMGNTNRALEVRF